MSAAGLKDQRITIQQRAAGVDGFGNALESWTDVCTTWAEAEALSGREVFAAGQQQASVDVRFAIRYRDGISAPMRVLWRGQAHDIVSVVPKGRKVEQVLNCTAGIKDGR